MGKFERIGSHRLMGRRDVVLGMALSGTGLLSACTPSPPTYATGDAAAREAALPGHAPTLFYVKSASCAICASFDQSQLVLFQRSDERQKLRLVTLHSPSISIRGSEWAGPHAWAVDAARSHGLLMATPLFVLTRDQTFVIAGYGIGDWMTEILPAVKKETA